ncbi:MULTISPECIES: energy-coupling factor transporter transmembrane component T family protein [Pseudanabaena]|uniref:ABC-type transporter, integral membrane subunit n=2 Tax=Pseudanabaena TaxID=1152 RepID=L8MY34_9CYAN|nr:MULTISPECIES: energy-coupling factor transporter transmembrane component T [Pseudanabaena]ELS31724.1 ABC-type transporter, integral membrane subunit [Pseudanabaena biceps PCC 7429]MDG3496032.1 energy-coupling factor transporter transmembrane component T [Pseudanabaena catenata USMAC16]
MKLQTVKYDSLFTRLDFRSKLLMMLTITILAFLWESPIAGGILMLSMIISCLFAGVKLDYLGGVFKLMIPFYIFLILSMGFFNVEQVKLLAHKTELTTLVSIPHTWWLIGGAKMSWEGTLYGLNIVFKTLTMILVIPLAIFTTDVNQMTVGMVRAKIPYKIVFIFSSTLRFVPLLLAESQSIIESQRLRGLNFEKMGWLQKGRVYAKIAIPLILNSLSKSQKLEIVLQSKAFSGSSQRTYLHESALTTADRLLMVASSILFLIAIALYFGLGIGKFAWLLYP